MQAVYLIIAWGLCHQTNYFNIKTLMISRLNIFLKIIL